MLKFAIFDLDETLYPADAGVMQHLSRRIDRYMIERMGLAPEYTKETRPRYWRQYGTTLRGLMQEHDVDPADYLWFVHDFSVDEYLQPDPLLAQVLRGLPLEKVIFTNSSADHCRRVTEALGIRDQFTHVFDIASVGYLSKPDLAAFQAVLRALEAKGTHCMMVEDNLVNLKAASMLGMTTVHVGREQPEPVADFSVREVYDVGSLVPGLIARGLLHPDQEQCAVIMGTDDATERGHEPDGRSAIC
jgi:putative hydrolase of the HAD superfamily